MVIGTILFFIGFALLVFVVWYDNKKYNERQKQQEGFVKNRYCIDYVTPDTPFYGDGKLNIRHVRLKDEESAKTVITILMKFKCKFIDFYIGNVLDGKLGDWTPSFFVDEYDYLDNEWIDEMKKKFNHKEDNEC